MRFIGRCDINEIIKQKKEERIFITNFKNPTRKVPNYQNRINQKQIKT